MSTTKWTPSVENPERCLCPINLRNYKVLHIDLSTIVLSLTHLYVMNRLNYCMLTVVCFSILHHKLLFLLPQGLAKIAFL